MSDISNSSNRVIMRIELLPKARDALSSFCKRTGMTQVATSSRLVDWLCNEQDVVQAAVLGLYPAELGSELTAMILKSIIARKAK